MGQINNIVGTDAKSIGRALLHSGVAAEVGTAAKSQDSVVTNEAAPERTPQFTKEYIMDRDSKVAQKIRDGKLVDASSRMDPSVLQYMQESAARRGLTNVRALVDTSLRDDPLPSIYVSETREGTKNVEVNEAFLHLKPEQQRAALDHELAHLQLGHTSTEGLTTEYNQIKAGNSGYRRAKEAQADQVGICHAHDPAATAQHLADALTVMKNDNIAYLRRKSPTATAEEIVARINEKAHTHPSIDQRIKDVLSYPASCNVAPPLATPNGTSSSGRQK